MIMFFNMENSFRGLIAKIQAATETQSIWQKIALKCAIDNKGKALMNSKNRTLFCVQK